MPLKHTNGWVVIDTETTHLDPDIGEIIEVSLMTSDGTWLDLRVKPQHIETASPKALEVNGYTPGAWERAEPPSEVVSRLTHLLAGRVIVGHNPHFDMRHLRVFYQRLGLEDTFHTFDRRLIDTTTLAYEWLVPHGLESTSLQNICKFLQIDNAGAHTAFRDVERTKAVFLRLCRPTVWDQHVGFRMLGRQYRKSLWLTQGGGRQ